MEDPHMVDELMAVFEGGAGGSWAQPPAQQASGTLPLPMPTHSQSRRAGWM